MMCKLKLFWVRVVVGGGGLGLDVGGVVEDVFGVVGCWVIGC
jgi:hypothetical protein